MASECLWDEPPADVTLPEDEVHVWCASLDQPASRIQALAFLLSEKERVRAGRFYFERDRRRFIVSQGFLRTILGRYVGIVPGQIEFCHGIRGKPALKAIELPNFPEGGLRFNTSHSHELALYAITRDREVGIDIEHIRPMPDAGRIVKRFFSAQECAAFQALPTSQRIEAFFNGWTRKEAFLKARGEGLSRPLNQFTVSLSPGEPARLLHFEGNPQETVHWSFQSLTPAPGYVAALVVEGHARRLACWGMR